MEQILDLPSTSQRTLQYAGFWIRFVAVLIDSILLGVVNSIIFSIAGVGMFTGDVSAFDMSAFFTAYGLVLILNIVYFVMMESSAKQATLGKMAVGIKVGDENGNRISAMNALGRNLGKYLSGFIFLIGYIIAAFDSKKQALHDKLAKTYVFYGK